MMTGALAHQRTSKYCFENPHAKPPSMDGLFFPAVSFELLLNSIEQSIRLILLMHYSILQPTHNIYALYKKVINKSHSKEGIRSKIVNSVNTCLRSINSETITEKDILTCLKKHDSSYSSFRYFGLNEDGRQSLKWEIKPYEVKLLHCFALALIENNNNEMQTRNIGVGTSLKEVPESEMTDDLRDLITRMKEQSTR